VIDEDRRLIAGQRRLEACKVLGWETIAVHVARLENILRGECDENVVREDFKPSEKDAIAEALEERERLAAKERAGRPGQLRSEKFSEQKEKGESRAKVAKAVGISFPSLKKYTKSAKPPKQNPRSINR
jgi:ParB family chromosome partitioning protein